MTVNPVNVLIVVDIQNDFIDGTLAIRNCGYGQEAAEVVKPVNKFLTAGRWDNVIYTFDWHPEDHISFFENLAIRELHPDSKVLGRIIGRLFMSLHINKIIFLIVR